MYLAYSFRCQYCRYPRKRTKEGSSSLPVEPSQWTYCAFASNWTNSNSETKRLIDASSLEEALHAQ